MKKLPKIEKHQIVWIFDVAQEYFKNKIRECEREIVVDSAMKSMEPIPQETQNKNRGDSINKNFEWIDKYKPVLEFCQIAKENAQESLSEDLARMFKESLVGKS